MYIIEKEYTNPDDGKTSAVFLAGKIEIDWINNLSEIIIAGFSNLQDFIDGNPPNLVKLLSFARSPAQCEDPILYLFRELTLHDGWLPLKDGNIKRLYDLDINFNTTYARNAR